MATKSFIERQMALAQAELVAIVDLAHLTSALVTTAWKASYKTIPKSRIVAEWRKINGL